MAIDPKEFGEVKEMTKSCKDGIDRIENSITTHLQNYRDDIKSLHGKSDKAHERVDKVDKELTGFRGKVIGFATAVSAIWALILKWIMGGD